LGWGLVSTTPLQWMLDNRPHQDTLAFQVDLWSADGELPLNLQEAEVRQKEIQYSSRTRAATDQFKHAQTRRAINQQSHARHLFANEACRRELVRAVGWRIPFQT
jgi:predicted acylesterase/phospholipase RssA